MPVDLVGRLMNLATVSLETVSLETLNDRLQASFCLHVTLARHDQPIVTVQQCLGIQYYLGETGARRVRHCEAIQLLNVRPLSFDGEARVAGQRAIVEVR